MVETKSAFKTKEKNIIIINVGLRGVSMTYNHTKNYFDFKGIRYGVGTVVRIRPEPGKNNKEIKRCNGVAKFTEGLDSGYLMFSGVVPPGSNNCIIGIFDKPEDRIEEIIEPVLYDNKPTWQIAVDNYQKTPRYRRADISPGTILYVAVMLLGVIFNARIVIWIIATLCYAGYLINIYRD